MKGRRIAEAVAIAAASVALLGLLEVAVRVWDRLSDGEWPRTRMVAFYDEIGRSFSLYRRHAFLNTAPREGHASAAFGKSASFNSLGYRSPERPFAKPDGVVRLLVAGGSTSFDLLASDDRATWPATLEGLLNASIGDGDCRVEVWNAGFPGWTSVENNVSLILRDLDLKPDFALFFQGINDLQAASLVPFDRAYESHAAEARRALGFELRPLGWLDRSLLLEKLRGRESQDPWGRIGPGHGAERLERLPKASVDAFATHVKAFMSLVHGAGGRPMLMTQSLRLRAEHLDADRRYLGGWLPGLEPDAAARELERLNAVLRAAAGEDGLLDAASDVPWIDADFGDAMHFQAAGSDKLARFVAERLVDDVGHACTRVAPKPNS
ncbi:MAG: SGNH/GDSL hydrolase family protein [Acidobacteriota bacterium]